MIVALWELRQRRAAKPGIRILGNQGLAENHQLAKSSVTLVAKSFTSLLLKMTPQGKFYSLKQEIYYAKFS